MIVEGAVSARKDGTEFGIGNVGAQGFDSLEEADELEEDYLDKAWGLEPESRLSCQARVSATNLVVEIPRYTINHAAERH